MTFLLISIVFSATSTTLALKSTIEWQEIGRWIKIRTESLTILFPAGGKKPMFLWWHLNDTSNIYVVKYKGLIEYLTFDTPYFRRKNEASGPTICQRLEKKFIEPKQHQLSQSLRNNLTQLITDMKANMNILYGLHPPLLLFSACTWQLSGPAMIHSEGKNCLSFNFTLQKAPPNFKFVENNVIIRCRIYDTSTTENVDNLYSYTVNAGELKMDFVVKNWNWNLLKIHDFLNELQKYNIVIPRDKTGLALWINLASINTTSHAENEITNQRDDLIEKMSTTSNMIVGGRKVQTILNHTAMEIDEKPITTAWRWTREPFKLRFVREDTTLAGFFKFVSSAKITDPKTSVSTKVNVQAAYIAAGAHMRLFIGYPYFAHKTLEHDPSIGIEAIPSLTSTELAITLVGTVSIIATIIAFANWKRKILNIIEVH